MTNAGSSNNLALSGRVALVTGGGRGIGRAIALGLARRGAAVVIHFGESMEGATTAVDEIRATGGEASAVPGDLQDFLALPGLVRAALDRYGRLDILVNNAGVYSSTPFEQVTADLWNDTFAVNLGALFFLCQAAAEPLRAHGAGVIVNLASDGGLTPCPGFPVSAPYAASKAGVVMLTRLLAQELAPTIRVNAVSPGVIASKPRPMRLAAREKYAQKVPLQRVGVPDDVAEAVAFLASDAASYITGQILAVNGGLSAA